MDKMSFITNILNRVNFRKKAKPLMYVACSIEYADSIEWREWFKQKLEDRYDVVLPDLTDCPHDKSNSQYPKWIFDTFVKPDIENVAICDEFFLFIDSTFINGAGAKAEVTVAAMLNKRITYCLHNVEFDDLNSWVIGCLYNANRVPDLKSAVQYYRKENFDEKGSQHTDKSN